MLKICYLGLVNLNWSRDIADYFSEHGDEVYFITLDKFRLTYSENVKIIRIRNRFGIFGYVLYAPYIKRIVNRINPDLLHVNWAAGYGLTSWLVNFHPLAISCIGCDVLLEEEKALRSPWRNLLVKLLIKRILKKADYLLPFSKNIKKKLISFGLPRERMKVFFAGPVIKDIIEEKDDATLLSNRKLVGFYQVDVFLKACTLIKKEFPNIKIIVAGEGDKEKEYLRLAHRLGLAENVEFTGWLPREEMFEKVSQATVFISTSPSDGTPQSVLEAMALKTPVVAADSQANKEWIKDGFNGYLFSVGDYKKAAGYILDLLKNKDKRKLFSERSYKIIRQKADFVRNIAKLEKLYNSLAKQQKIKTPA